MFSQLAYYVYLHDWIIQAAFYALLAASLFITWWGFRSQKRQRWLMWLGVLLTVCLLYARIVEPRLLTVKTYRLALVPQPKVWIKAVMLYDAHAGQDKGAWYYAWVERTAMAQKPDVILVGGDFVDFKASAITELDSWKNLTAPLGKYFVLGNHDYLDDPARVRTYARDTLGLFDLTNAALNIKQGGRSLTVVGLDDAHSGQPDYALLNESSSTRPLMIFTHQADTLLHIDSREADLLVSGHTHGGQVRFPFLGTPAVLPQALPHWMDRGLKDWQGLPVLISQGLGEAVAPLRFDCPPQIVVAELGI